MGNSSPSSGSLIGLKPKLVRNESTRKKKKWNIYFVNVLIPFVLQMFTISLRVIYYFLKNPQIIFITIKL